MASFSGTNKEFKRYIGPQLRNLVQQITKKHKIAVGACEHCGSNENLESAHIEGRDRNDIIDIILKNYTQNYKIDVDLGLFETKFKEEHHPIEKSILILCRSCHRKYDSKHINSKTTENPSSTKQYDCLPITLDPSNPDIFKQELLLTKKAEIETHYSNGDVKTKYWNASKLTSSSGIMNNLRSRPEYRSGKWQLHAISKVHVRVIKD